MKHFLLLKNIRVENANAISGMTWGFPSPTHFLGYVHALSRTLQQRLGEQATLGGVGIICHQHQVHAYKPNGFDRVFALTRNPLTKDGKTAPFNEEGRMHMTVSLLVECEFDVLDVVPGNGLPEQRIQQFRHLVQELATSQRLAGGTVTELKHVGYWSLDTHSESGQRWFKRQMLRLIPGFVLTDRSTLLKQHHEQRLQHNPGAELLDSWLDFVALCYQPDVGALTEGEVPTAGATEVEWKRIDKPASGYLVPLAIGYEAISKLYEPGAVARARDNTVPFRFVESAYGIGEWQSPHRFDSPEPLLWRYQQHDGSYLCQGVDLTDQSESVHSHSSDDLDDLLDGWDF